MGPGELVVHLCHAEPSVVTSEIASHGFPDK